MAKVDLDKLGAQYREAKQSVTDHLRRQGLLELERLAYLKTLRGVPSDELYDRQTGNPLDPRLRDMEAGIEKAQTDVAWCQALVIACGEAYKGESFAEVLKRHEPNGRTADGAADEVVSRSRVKN